MKEREEDEAKGLSQALLALFLFDDWRRHLDDRLFVTGKCGSALIWGAFGLIWTIRIYQTYQKHSKK